MTRQIIITGGTGGLGQAVVQHFLNVGDQVHVLDLPPDGSAFLARLGQPEALHYHALNVTDPAAVSALAAELGQADVLVNLVGGFYMGSVGETPVEQLQKMLDLNLRSAFVMIQGLLPLLQTSGQGRIVNVGARQALLGGPGVSAYAVSKAAVVNLTQSLAQELRDSGVTVNAVVPSTIDTPANRESMPDADFDAWVKPQDLAEVIAFLASPAARAVSGAVVPVYHRA